VEGLTKEKYCFRIPSISLPRSLMSRTILLDRHTSESTLEHSAMHTFININLHQHIPSTNTLISSNSNIRGSYNAKFPFHQPTRPQPSNLQNNHIRPINSNRLLQPRMSHKTVSRNNLPPALLQPPNLLHHKIPIPRLRRIKIKLIPKRPFRLLPGKRLVKRVRREDHYPRNLSSGKLV
jgi:hypothetical protein